MKAILLLATSLCAFAQIEQPRIGVMVDSRGEARAVLGVASSATVSEPLWSGVLALACSTQLCVAKTPSALVSSTGEVLEAPEGRAVLAIGGTSVYAYFPEARQLVRWRDGRLESLEFMPTGEVVDLRVTANGVDYATRRDGKPVLLLDGASLLAVDKQVRLVHSDGTEKDFPIANAAAFIRMSDVYVQIITPDGSWALRIEAGREEVFLLPGVPQE